MAIDWDAELLAPVMAVFGEGDAGNPASWPIYTPRGLPAFALPGAVFDAAYQDVTVNDDQTTTTAQRPVLGVRTSLFAQLPAQNDKVFIPSTGKTYLVREPRPDGHGHALLMLMETAA